MKTKASTGLKISIEGEKRFKEARQEHPLLRSRQSSVLKNITELKNAFTSILVGQDETFRRLSSILFGFHGREKSESPKERILPLLLSGVSGTGKTGSVEIMRKVFEILPHCYIYWDLSQLSDETKLNQILGAGAGLVGFGEMMTLPKQLENAVKPFTPSYILLHLDELGEAHYRFLSLMINFLETGRLSSTDGLVFQLPEETRLIVVFTANFGYQRILTLDPLENYQEAEEAILDSMREYGISKAVLGRLPHVLPFFAFSRETLESLAGGVIDCLFECSKGVEFAYRNFFTHFSQTPQKSLLLLSRVIITYLLEHDRSLGMRAFHSKVSKFKSQLFGDTILSLSDSLSFLSSPLLPEMDYLLVSPSDYGSLENLMSDHPHAFSLQTRSQIRRVMEENWRMEFILIRHQNFLLASLLCNTPPSIPRIRLKSFTRSLCHVCGGESRDSEKRVTFRESRTIGAYKILIFHFHCNLCPEETQKMIGLKSSDDGTTTTTKSMVEEWLDNCD